MTCAVLFLPFLQQHPHKYLSVRLKHSHEGVRLQASRGSIHDVIPFSNGLTLPAMIRNGARFHLIQAHVTVLKNNTSNSHREWFLVLNCKPVSGVWVCCLGCALLPGQSQK